MNKSIIETINRALHEVEMRKDIPNRIQIGEAQARQLADELNAKYIPLQADEQLLQILFGVPDEEPVKPLTWEDILHAEDGQMGTLFGVQIEGVESPDYLNITVKERIRD
jgi:hypothetical protein